MSTKLLTPILALLTCAALPACDGEEEDADFRDGYYPYVDPETFCHELVKICEIGTPECTETLTAVCWGASPCKACILAADVPGYGPAFLEACELHDVAASCPCER